MLTILRALELPVIEALGWALVHFVWQAALLAGLLAVLLLPLRRASARVRYLVQCAVLLAMAACPLGTWWWIGSLETVKPAGLASASDPVVVRDARLVDVVPAFGPVVTNLPALDEPIMVAPAPFVHDRDNRPMTLEPSPLEETHVEPAVSWIGQLHRRLTPALPWLVSAWLLGVVVLSLRLLVGWRVVQQLKRLAVTPAAEAWQAKLKDLAARLRISRPVKLVESAMIEVPTVIGWLRPVILLPISVLTSLTPQQLEAVLAHELAHIRRHDYLANLIQTAIETLLFYHPAVWWVSSLIRAEREHCCDDLALRLCNNAVTYVTALAAMEELRASPTLTIAATGGSLLGRIRRIAVGPDHVSRRSIWWGASLIALMVIASLGLTTYFASHANDEPKTTAEQTVTTPQTDTANDASPSISSPAPDWGKPVNGLRARIIPVLSSMSEDAIDFAERVAEFDTLDDVGFAVEIENISDKPVSLRDLRYGNNYGESSGKMAVDWFGQFLFSIHYFDADGKPIERPELIPVGKEMGMAGDALTSILKPKQTIKMLLRPNRWISVLSQQPMIGKQSAVVKYRGAAEGKAAEVVAPAVEFTVMKRGYRPSGAPALDPFDDPKNDPELEPDITKQVAWGEPVNGLRAALDVIPEGHFKALSHGSKPKLKLLVQNVSDKPVTLASLMWLSELPVKATNAKGDAIEVPSVWYSGITPVVRLLLKPQQVVTFDAGNLGLAITKERAEKFGDVTHRRLVAPSGKYSLRATERFGTSFQLKDGAGNVTVPADGDFKGDLTTGAANLDLSNEVIECEIVDAVTGKLISDTTTSFLFIKPKTANSEETTVANMIWGPKGPGRIYFTIPTIPEDIAQRADRDELLIQWGTGNNPDYEDHSPTERIPLKEFFHEGPKTARETLSKIKLTPKKKVAATSLPADNPNASASLTIKYDMPGAEAETRIFVERIDPEFQSKHGRRDEYGSEEYGGVRFSRLKNGDSFTLKDLPAGKYRLARYRLVDIVRVGTGKAHNSVYLDRQWIELADKETKTISLSRPAGQPISGRVVIPEDLKVNTLVVHVSSENAGSSGSLIHRDVLHFDALNADADGKFKTEPLPPGRYKIIVDGYANHNLAASGIIVPSWAGTAQVTVTESVEPASIEVTLHDFDREAWLKDLTIGTNELEFLKPYPKLQGLSLDMTESQFLEIVKQQELTTRKAVASETGERGNVTHRIDLGDGHTLIVMFDKDAKCSGIQRVRGEDDDTRDRTRPQAPLPVLAGDADTETELLQKLVRGGKIDTKTINTWISLVAARGAQDAEFTRLVLAELEKSCDGGDRTSQSRRFLLAVLTDIFEAWSSPRWQLQLGRLKPDDLPQTAPPQVDGKLEREMLARVIQHGYETDRSEIANFSLAVRQLHHPAGREFLRDVLRNPASESDPFAPTNPPKTVPQQRPQATPVPKSNSEVPAARRWKDNVGGGWTDAKFVAAIGLAELGEEEGIDWLLARAQPNKFGIDGSLWTFPHIKESRGSLRESSRLALADLFGLSTEVTVTELGDWWRNHRAKFTARPAMLKPRAGREEPALDPKAGVQESDKATTTTEDANGDLRSNTSAGSGAPRSQDNSGWTPELRVLRNPSVLLPDHWIMQAVGFDNDSKELVTASNQSFITIRRWDVVGMKLISEIKLQADVHGRTVRDGTLMFSGDRRRVIGATDAYVGMWETATGKLLKQLPIPKVGDNDTVRLLACTPDLSVIVGNLETNYDRMTLVYDAHTVVWDGNSGKMLRINTHHGQNDLMALSLSSDGKRFATTNGGVATVWDTRNGEQLLQVTNDDPPGSHSNHIWSIQLSPDGKQLAMVNAPGVKLLDATSGKLLQQLVGSYRYSSNRSPGLVYSKDGQWLARLGTRGETVDDKADYVVPIWSTRTGAKLFELHTQSNAAAFSDDGQRLAVGFSDLQQALSVWSLNADAANIEPPAGPGPHSRQDRVEENGHYVGKTAAEYIDKFKPTWGEAKLGLQYGLALTKPQRQFRVGERVPLVAFFRNASDKPIKFDTMPDYFGNMPKVRNAKGEPVALENIPLLGHIPHYYETLAPGEALGPLYLSIGLGENPRPGQQHWQPFYKSPVTGKYNLTHAVSVNVAGQKDGEAAKKDELTSSTIEFEIVDGVAQAASNGSDFGRTGTPARPAPDEKKNGKEAKATGKSARPPSGDSSISLADVVRDFNGENKQLGRGLDQPALTEDEVLAVLKQDEWKPENPSLNEPEIAAFKAVAQSKRLPSGSYLQVHTETRPETFVFRKLWLVRLMLPAIGHDGFVGLTIRDTDVVEEKIDPKTVAWGQPDADGLSLGAYLSPKKQKYALGERVKLRLFVRNDGKQALGNLTFYNIAWPEPKDFTVTDQAGAAVAVRSVHDEWSGPQWIAGAIAGRLAAGDAHAFRVPFELAIGDDAPSQLVGRVIDARPGQKLALRVREHNGSDHNKDEPEPESGVVSFTVAAADDAKDQAPKPNAAAKATAAKTIMAKELASFQGTWCWDFSQPWTWPQPIGVGTDSDGRKSEKRWVIEGNQITWVGRDGQPVHVTFTIDPLKAPKQIDFTFLDGPHKGKKSIGIYEPVDGDANNLWLCMTDPGADAPRPTDISAGSFKKQSMIAIYKVEPPKPAVTKELEPFQGFWQMGLCDTANKTLYLPNDEIPKRRWRVKGNQIVWSQKGEEWRLQFKVDPSKSPKEFDLKYLSGPFAGKTCLGMYEFGGVGNQVLQIAIQDPGANVPRPTKLSMTGTSQTGLIFLSPVEMSEAERDLASLQGTWTLRNFDTMGWPMPKGKGPDKSGEGSELRWVVQGNEITWTSRSGEEIQASFTIDPKQRPKHIDLTLLSGPDKGETCRGLYQHDDLDENILWLCMANPGSMTDRPKEFSYEWGKGRSVLSLYPFNPPEPGAEQSSAVSQPKPTPSAEPAPAAPEKPIPKELEPFQGIWPMDICDSANRTLYAPQKVVNTWRWAIKGNEITWTRSAGEVWHLTFTVDPTKTPKEIDLTYLDGPFKDKTCLGMYEWGGVGKTMLQMSVQDPGAKVPRPKDISMTGSGQTSLIFLDPRQSPVSQTTPDRKTKPAVDPVPVPKELKTFQGTWAVDSCESEAATLKVSKFAARRWRWTIEDNQIRWGREGQEWKLKFKIDPAQTPKQIDLTFLDGPLKDEKCLGIYDWDGSEGKNLKILMQDPGAKVDRPTSFERKAGSRTSLITLRPLPPIDPEKELASFQGTWSFDLTQPWTWPQPIGVGTDGEGRKSEKRWVIEGNEITWVGRDGERVDVNFTIDPFKAPKQIEFTFFNGQYKGKKSIGIYEPIDGNENNRWLCMTDPGSDAPRPTDVSASSFAKQSMIGMHKIAPPEIIPAAKALERLQGVWNVTLCDSALQTFGATMEEASKWQWTIKGNEILWSRQGEVWKLKLDIHPTRKLTEIDLTYLSGPFQGQKSLGVYEFSGNDGQSLQVAIQTPGAKAARPSGIEMRGDGKSALIFLRPSKPSDAERELAALQGTWTLRKFDTGNFERNKDPSSWPLPGGKGPDKSGEGSELRWVVKQNEITWTSPAGQEIKASFKIDSHQRPKQIDLTFLSGPDKGETCPGIYQRDDLDENILWLCLADPGSKKGRPTEFSYGWNEGRSLLSLYPFIPVDPKSKPGADPPPASLEKPVDRKPLPDGSASRGLSDGSNKPLVLVGHFGSVTSVAFSPDGKRVASSSRDKTIRVWDTETGKQVFGVRRSFSEAAVDDEEDNYSQDVAFSPDGKWLAGTGGADKNIHFWVAGTGQVATDFYTRGHVRGMAYSRDGTRLVSIDSEVKVWDANLDDHRGGHILALNARDASSMAFSPDAKRVATADRDRTIRFWNAVTGEEQLAIKQSDDISGLAFSPDGKRLASAGANGVDVWDAATGRKLFKLQGLAGVSSVAFSPDGRWLASAGGDKLVKLWDAKTGQEWLSFQGHENKVLGLAFSADGKRLASSSADRTVRLWNVPPPPKLEPRGDTKVESPTASEPNPPTPAEDKSVGGQKPLVLVGHTAWITGVAFSPDGKRVASCGRDKAIKVWDSVTGQELLTLKRTARNANDGHTSYVEDVAFSPDGKYLASAGGTAPDGLYVWSAVSGRALCRLSTHTNFVMAVAYSPDGTRLASASSDNTVKVWDANPEQHNGTPILSLDASAPLSVTFSPDGKRLAAAGRDKTIRIWNAVTGELLVTAKHSDQLTCVAFSPDGTRFATAGPTGVNVWDASTGKMLFAVPGLSGVSGVAYSPDGKRLASTGWDKLVKLWDATTGRELLTLRAHGNSVGGVAFSPDGKRLATGSHDWTVRVWDLPPFAAVADPKPPVPPEKRDERSATPDETPSANNSGVQAVPPLLEFRIAAQPDDSKFEPRVPADYAKRDYSGNSVIGRVVARDKGFVWVPVAVSKGKIAALPVERLRGGQVREALLADTPEHSMPFNGKWSIEDCRVAPDPNGGDHFVIELKLNEAGGDAMKAMTKSHFNQPLAIVVNNQILAAPIIRSEIGRRIAITGNFTREEADKLVADLDTASRKELGNKKPPGEPTELHKVLVDAAAQRQPGVPVLQNAKLGSLTGRFVYGGVPPVHNIRPNTEDQSLLIDKDGGVANVVVWVFSKEIPWTPPADLPQVTLQVKDGNFTPHVTTLTVGQPLLIENLDPVPFQISAEFMKALNPSISALLKPAAEKSPLRLTFRAAENYPAHLSSNIGPWARGSLFVHANPFVAVTQPDGTFTLPNLPPGEWEFLAWHARTGYVSHWPKGQFKHKIQTGVNDMGTIKLKPEQFGQVNPPTPPPNREQVGEVLGQPVYRDQVTDHNLDQLFFYPILGKYKETHQKEMTPTHEEAKYALEYFERMHRERLKAEGGEAKFTERMGEIEKQLAAGGLSHDEEQKLEAEHLDLRSKLKSPAEMLTAWVLVCWKAEKHIYQTFGGGRVLVNKFGCHQAFDANRVWRETAEKNGDFKITDPALRAKFYEPWTRDRGAFLHSDKDEVRRLLLEPEFVAPTKE